MNAQSKVAAPTLAALREPFAANHISKLPKETKAQTEERKANRASAAVCKVCGGWHHKNAVHLDYVGHAALTDRLLDTDLEWTWEPVAFTPEGLPAFDRNGGLWIKLTVLGVTRLGYGSADGKSGGDAVKEIIGDALRNAAMRFGAALDLWHKGDLHVPDDDTEKEPPKNSRSAPDEQGDRAKIDDNQWAVLVQLIEAKGVDTRKFCEWLKVPSLKDIESCDFFKAKEALEKKPDPIEADSIPY